MEEKEEQKTNLSGLFKDKKGTMYPIATQKKKKKKKT